MRVFEFIDKECKDLVEVAKKKRDLVDFGEYPHDDIIYDSDDKPVPVVLVNTRPIPVIDFFTMDKEDFVKAWKVPGADVAYDNYISMLNVLEGPDVINVVRNKIMAATEQLQHDVDLAF